MSDRITDGDFNTATRVSLVRYSRAFPGDATFYLAEADYQQKGDYFARLPLGTQLLENRPFRLVDEVPLQEIGAGIIQWTRKFARPPAPRTEYESYAWRRPGYTNDSVYFQRVISGTPAVVNGRLRITVVGNHGLTVGDSAVVRYTVRLTSSEETGHSVSRKVLALVGNSSFEVSPIVGTVTAWNSVEPGGLTRPVETRVVTSRMEIFYHHVGATGDVFQSPEQLDTVNPVTIYNSSDQEGDSYSDETTPTVTEYLADVSANKWIVVEGSIVRRWLGKIYEVSTRKVRAQ